MLDFDVYLGRIKEPILYGLGYRVIMKMAKDYLGKGHCIFFYKLFSSVKLGQDLEKKEMYKYLMIRLNRTGWPKELNSAKEKKKRKPVMCISCRMATWLQHFGRTKDLLPSCLPMLSHGWGNQRGRLQEERRRY